MHPINMKRVVLGGVVAAVVVNAAEGLFALLMKSEWEEAIRRLGLRLETGPAAYLPFAWSIVIGVLTIWLYAAIRPRYGPGVKTAVRAALAVWAFGSATFALAMGSLGLFPARLMTYVALWSLAEVTVAVMIGAALYREEGRLEIS